MVLAHKTPHGVAGLFSDDLYESTSRARGQLWSPLEYLRLGVPGKACHVSWAITSAIWGR